MNEIVDLRSALAALERHGERIEEIDARLDPHLALLDDYLASYRTPHGTWMSDAQPLRRYRAPASGAFPVLLGVFGSRARTRFWLDPDGRADPRTPHGALLAAAVARPLPPEAVRTPAARTVVRDPDLRAWLPALTCSAGDPGPTVTLGLVYARDPASGAANASVHRITLKRGAATIALGSSGHLRRMLDACVARGARLPVSVNIGLDPALYYAAALSAPALEFGDDELAVAGALRGRPVGLAACASHAGWCIDHAEIVLEGSLGAEQASEGDAPGGHAMPEYLGYYSPAGVVPALAVSALTFREGACYQAVSGPGREQSELLGAGQEAAVWRVLAQTGAGPLVRDVGALAAGGGHLFTVLQCAPHAGGDDARLHEAAQQVLERVASTKNLVLVDTDVQPHAADDVLWAIATRCRLEHDLAVTRSLRGTSLDPTQSADYCAGGMRGHTRKCVIDCLVPLDQRARFRRAFSPA
jgi:gallate decarboxylase subunit C